MSRVLDDAWYDKALRGDWTPVNFKDLAEIIRMPEEMDTKEELKHELRAHGRAFDERATCDRLLYLVNRMYRGLLDYEKCSYEELLRFCSQRGLSVSISRGKGKGKRTTALVTKALVHHPHISRFTKKQLIGALEKADKQPTFTRFSDLPAELRNHVYDSSFSYYGLPPIGPSGPPPIAQASRLTRKESLPLYYATHALRLDIDGLKLLEHRHEKTRAFVKDCPDLAKLYRHISISLEWHFSVDDYDEDSFARIYAHWIVTLEIQGNGYKVELIGAPAKTWKGLDKILTETEADIGNMFEKIAAGFKADEAIELSVADWEALESMLKDAHVKAERLHEDQE